ncbi:peroxynitrite isomerase THAP4-like [Ixodes scapularis]
MTGGHAAPGASSQKNASGEIVTVNAMEDFTADFMCHAVATEDSVGNDCNIDDCVNAATGAVLDRAESLKWATNVWSTRLLDCQPQQSSYSRCRTCSWRRWRRLPRTMWPAALLSTVKMTVMIAIEVARLNFGKGLLFLMGTEIKR